MKEKENTDASAHVRRFPEWLQKAVFYEIYPQSFRDSNADGIGDIPGIVEKLDYIRDLGCTAIWINPCFDSPFKDAGYDVRDYRKVAPRYGTNEDLVRLFAEAHSRGIRVLLDLIPGHTSEEHPWFIESGKASKNELSERYIWTDFWIHGIEGRPYIGGECERNGVYMINFFKCQPALNYGFREKKENWQYLPSDPECIATREAVKDIMRFWLSLGCDGFRVDMADSLVKGDDEDKSATCMVWRDILSVLEEFPEAAVVSEWCNPAQAVIGAGFDMDFVLDHRGNCYNALMRDNENAITGPQDHSYVKKDTGCSLGAFLPDLMRRYEAVQGACTDGDDPAAMGTSPHGENPSVKGVLAWLTCNHDTPRPSYNLTEREIKLAFGILMTLPGVPFIYYGDEIGMRYCKDLPTKEGGYTRTGSRTPMQWSEGVNKGFSEGPPESLYLPVDLREDAPTVESQIGKQGSLLETVRSLTALKAAEEGLRADAPFVPLTQDPESRLWAYRRGDLLIAVNPSGERTHWKPDHDPDEDQSLRLIFVIGEAGYIAESSEFVLQPQSFAVWKSCQRDGFGHQSSAS